MCLIWIFLTNEVFCNPLQNVKVKRLNITHKDRLTRFGYEYLETFFESYGTKIIVTEDMEEKNAQEEMVEDMMSLLASFSGKLYGMRSSRRKEAALEAAEIIEKE